MKSKGNIICIILLIIIIALFSVYRYYEDEKTQIQTTQLDQMRKQYEIERLAEEQEKAEKEAHYAAIREDIPGIVCWGDDMTYGKGGIEKSYPYVLENLLNANGYQLPVFNNGVSGEDSLTVFGRAGAIPYITNGFNIGKNTELYEMDIRSSYNGEPVNPLLRKRNPGLNPCTINGVKGTLYGLVLSADLDKVEQFYFARSNSGNEVWVPDGTEIIVDGVNYKDYINIVAVGENGGWNDAYSLIEQHSLFVDYLKGSKNAESYIILGMSKGTAEENKLIEELMVKNFGSHYINIREYLSGDAMSDLGLTPTENDKKMMEIGQVPESLMYDENNLNDYAYDAIGTLVYNKLVEFNYIKK